MTDDEKQQLIRGVGWNLTTSLPGYYVGNIGAMVAEAAINLRTRRSLIMTEREPYKLIIEGKTVRAFRTIHGM